MIAKKLFFMSILFCICAQGTENDFKHPITRKTIDIQELFLTQVHTQTEINNIRSNWLSDFKENCNILTKHASDYIIYHYLKFKYEIGPNEEKCNLITDEIFQEILPTLCSKLDLHKVPSEIFSSAVFSASKDPYIINNLLYNYNLNFLDYGYCMQTFLNACMVGIKIMNIFREDKIERPLHKTIFFILPAYIKRHGFFIDNILYEKESKTDKFGTHKKQTSKDRIRYMKIVFSPHVYKKILPKEFPLELKESFYTFLLCMKRNHQKSKIPKVVLLDVIAPYCERYAYAQHMYPKLIKQTEIFKELRKTEKKEDKVINFMCDHFMTWFNEEKLK